jgi:hypothetical protein
LQPLAYSPLKQADEQCSAQLATEIEIQSHHSPKFREGTLECPPEAKTWCRLHSHLQLGFHLEAESQQACENPRWTPEVSKFVSLERQFD